MASNDGAVLVTGASGGIGVATVRALADQGMTVFATVRDDQGGALDGVAGVRMVEMDVTDPKNVELAAEQVAQGVGDRGLRAVVNNAGVIVQGPLELVPPEELRRQFEVNTFGPAYVTQAFLPLLRRGHGRIVNVTAPTARVTAPFLGPISASKAALNSLSTAMRGELAAWKIPVTLVEPGAIATQIFAKAEAAARSALANTDPARAALYGPHLTAVARATEKQSTSPPEAVARTIVKAVQARRPKRRYAATRDARVMGLLSHLPAGVRESMVLRAFGLSGIKAGA
ncbi:SDR family NAD(P)-dependent oxidoreductase [Actinobacteria bacterium YIM 96077]|uniref:Short-chain dehydrogenase n=1 Tax=Phytoactinopolyspora halophila TaxID=1981511 RepID=A0A329QAR8_9ACTN|nr:SDR family NAD(P)-dependent oxidoreductase [Phytoactinopolyspora halophila]AYY13744.1 SDR family NAD(P)-dependent oxidoreductase [Actinobacteria bacterium YIM 96077]RAW09475.1 short-chain dehydrogenase [Phytoactinopolyspora halophila]